MPPSGFTKGEQTKGILKFVKGCYEATLLEYEGQIGQKSESDFLMGTIGFLEKTVQETIAATPLHLSRDAITGITTFVTSCYKDLIQEMYVGKDKYGRLVIEGKAMKKELNQIEYGLLNISV